MQITSINQINCKPKRLSFTSNDENNSVKGKKRYKHYEEVSDDVLKMRSILNAHKEVENSGKMHLFKAIPAITTGLIGLSISLAQPGKLSARAAQGLGFLALVQASNFIFNKIDKHVDKKYIKKNDDNSAKKSLEKASLYLLSGAALIAGVLNIKKLGNIKALEPITQFISKEAGTLAKEVNETKLGKFVEETINPFTLKHKDANLTASILAPFAALSAGTFASLKIADSLSDDIKEKAEQNYTKGKLIQSLAKEHFDTIDAQEV